MSLKTLCLMSLCLLVVMTGGLAVPTLVNGGP